MTHTRLFGAQHQVSSQIWYAWYWRPLILWPAFVEPSFPSALAPIASAVASAVASASGALAVVAPAVASAVAYAAGAPAAVVASAVVASAAVTPAVAAPAVAPAVAPAAAPAVVPAVSPAVGLASFCSYWRIVPAAQVLLSPSSAAVRVGLFLSGLSFPLLCVL